MLTEKDLDEFESAMSAKARAEARHLSSQATLRRGGCVCLVLLGVGGLILLSGEGVSLATRGMYAAQETETTVAAILAQNREQNRDDLRDMLAATPIHGTVTGEVTGEVSVKDGGTVRVIGQAPDMPRAQPEQARQDDLPPLSKAGVLRNFTVLQSVTFGVGEVHSAWEYRDGGRRPSFQYCHYTQLDTQLAGDATTQTHVRIGENGRMTLPNPSPLPSVNLRAAYEAGCFWANDPAQAVAPVAPVAPVQTIQIHAAKR